LRPLSPRVRSTRPNWSFAKLDRLARNVRFLLTLVHSGVEVLSADMPQVSGAMGRFMLISMANVAELEAGLFGERTKAALATARERGKRLGVKGAEVLAPRGGKPMSKIPQEQFPGVSHRRVGDIVVTRSATASSTAGSTCCAI
jgi:hypothetical protein